MTYRSITRTASTAVSPEGTYFGTVRRVDRALGQAWVEIPRLAKGFDQGPLAVISTAFPVVGDRVACSFLEGRNSNLVVIGVVRSTTSFDYVPPVACTSTNRPESLPPGTIIFETDTTDRYVWTGVDWEPIGDGATGPAGPIAYVVSPEPPDSDDVLWLDSDELVAAAIGPTGPTGPTGPAGSNGATGATGPTGGSIGVPTGGATSQVLSKRTTGNYDTQWVDRPWYSPWGILAYAGKVNDQTISTTFPNTAQISGIPQEGLVVSAFVPAGRTIRVSFFSNAKGNFGTNFLASTFLTDSTNTALQRCVRDVRNTSDWFPMTMTLVYTTSMPEQVTWKARASTSATSTFWILSANVLAPAFLMIEDLGPDLDNP